MTWHRYIGWIGFVTLLLLHLDFWRSDEVVLYFGWLPHELAYRVGWMLLAWAYLGFFCRYLWPAPDPPAEAGSGPETNVDNRERP